MRHSKIFNTEEVRAIRDGRMTAFYEIVKPQPEPPRAIYNEDECEVIVSPTPNLMGGQTGVRFNWKSKRHPNIRDAGLWKSIIPYPLNKQIYVRESWLSGYEMDDAVFILDKDGEMIPKIWYREETPNLSWYDGNSDWPLENTPWKSPATMLREAARNWIEITGVKCLRVQDIMSGELELLGHHITLGYGPVWYEDYHMAHIEKYGEASWAANPFIFLYDFKLIK